MDRNTKLLGEIIDFMRAKGITIDSPYDFENWMDDNASHSQQFETGRFKHLQEDDDESK